MEFPDRMQDVPELITIHRKDILYYAAYDPGNMLHQILFR